MKKVILYTDGSCLGNPGPGGWCAILLYNHHKKILSGGEASTTNNRMELTAIIKGLEQLKEPCEVWIHTDSAYILNAFIQGWLENWKINGWKRKEKGKKVPVKNLELWQKLSELSTKHDLHWVKIEAHTGEKFNEECDRIARAEASKMSQKISSESI
jgi:ribonuclease HI